MNKLSTITISLALCGLLLLTTTTAHAASDCYQASGTVVGNLVAPAVTCPMGTIGGVAGDVFDASANFIGTTSACLTSLEPQGTNGALHATLMHTFIFTAGELQGVTIGTQDQAVLSPVDPPLFRVNNQLDITTGGSGFLRTHGTANFISGEVTLRYNGRICTDY